MEWKNTDPRFDIYKSRAIIIVRPRTPGIDRARISVATAETKHGYSVFTDFESPYNFLGAKDDWPEDWQWMYYPEPLNLQK